MKIECADVLAKALIEIGAARQITDINPIEPVLPLWQRFVASVKASNMSDAMKIACVAQAIIESGRGTSRVAKELTNFHGIKFRDTLDGLAEPARIEVTSETQGWDIFAKFPDTDTAVRGWLKFLTREYYKGWEEHKDNSPDFIRHIGQSWCPAVGYAEKVIKAIGEAEILLGIEAQKKDTPKQYKIFLDPGHSERKPGARSNDGTAQEEDLNRLQAGIIKKELEATGRFICTIFDPDPDNLVAVGKAAKGHDMSIHLHHNSYSGNADPGTEVLYDNDKAESQSKDLAKLMSETIAKSLGTKDRGAKPFAGTVMDYAEQQGNFPVVLPESYFLNSYTKQQAEERSSKAAIAIADAVKRWFRV